MKHRREAAPDDYVIVGARSAGCVVDRTAKKRLYADVKPQYLHDGEADRAAIFRALGSVKANMAKDETGQDLAVILFSGHGATFPDFVSEARPGMFAVETYAAVRAEHPLPTYEA